MQHGYSRRNVGQSIYRASRRRPHERRRLRFDCLEDRRLLSGGSIAPSGPQFMVNTTTEGTQTLYPSIGFPCGQTVAMDASGNTVAVWESQQLNSSGQPTGYWTLMFQLYTKTFDNAIGNYDLQPRGGETPIAVVATGSNGATEAAVAVARAPTSGNFVVAWDAPAGLGQSLSTASTFAQLYSSSGSPIGSTILVAGSANGGNVLRSVAMSDTGFDVLYAGHTLSGKVVSSSPTLYVERYSSSGALQGSALTVVNKHLSGGDDLIATDTNGNFDVVWADTATSKSHSQTILYTINAQRYTSAGKTVGSAIQLNPNTSVEQIWCSAGMDSTGDVVASWGDVNGNVMLRQVSAAGSLGNVINLGPAPSPGAAALAVQPSGAFDVAYRNGSGTVAETFDASGNVLQPAFAVNGGSSLAVDSAGDLVMVWAGAGTAGTGDTGDVFGQFFVDPPALAPTTAATASSPSGSASPSGTSSAATDAAFAAYAYPDDDMLA